MKLAKKNYPQFQCRGLFICSVTVFCLLLLAPFFFMILTSLKTMEEVQAVKFIFIPKQWVFSNYWLALRKGNWGRYFFNTAYITVITVAVSLLINSMAGFAFARLRFPSRNLLFLIALVGMMVPFQVTMIPVFINLKNFPLAGGNNWLGVGGTGLINTYWGLVLPYISGAFGVFLCRQYYLNFPAALDDAAKIDGCSTWQIYRLIYLPLSKSVLATLAVLKTSQVWNDYTWPLIITNQDRMLTVQLALITNFVSEFKIDWNLLMAMTTLSILPLVILFTFTQRYFIEGVVTTGIKG
jgi:multiple sugar transport system permease protein